MTVDDEEVKVTLRNVLRRRRRSPNDGSIALVADQRCVFPCDERTVLPAQRELISKTKIGRRLEQIPGVDSPDPQHRIAQFSGTIAQRARARIRRNPRSEIAK